jgi:hypothetical protein
MKFFKVFLFVHFDGLIFEIDNDTFPVHISIAKEQLQMCFCQSADDESILLVNRLFNTEIEDR